jgi:hypothetical protein
VRWHPRGSTIGAAVRSVGDEAVPADGDVHLRIWLGAIAFDYRASAAAAYHLMRDWQRRRWCAVERIVHSAEEHLPETRLPNERLFLGP